MAKTDFAGLAQTICMQVGVRYNIEKYEDADTIHIPPKEYGVGFNVSITFDELKALGNVKRIRDAVSKNDSGEPNHLKGFFKRLKDEIERHHHKVSSIVVKNEDEQLIVAIGDAGDLQQTHTWQKLIDLNKRDMLQNKQDIEAGNEYVDDYRDDCITDIRIYEWEYFI